MKHNWQEIPVTMAEFGRGTKRECLNCGKYQIREEVAYDVMRGSTYRWLPLVGRCKGVRNDTPKGNIA